MKCRKCGTPQDAYDEDWAGQVMQRPVRDIVTMLRLVCIERDNLLEKITAMQEEEKKYFRQKLEDDTKHTQLKADILKVKVHADIELENLRRKIGRLSNMIEAMEVKETAIKEEEGYHPITKESFYKLLDERIRNNLTRNKYIKVINDNLYISMEIAKQDGYKGVQGMGVTGWEHVLSLFRENNIKVDEL